MLPAFTLILQTATSEDVETFDMRSEDPMFVSTREGGFAMVDASGNGHIRIHD